MSDRSKQLLDVRSAIQSAVREMESDWPASKLNDPMLTNAQRDLLRTRLYDIERLKQGQQIVEAMIDKADGWSTLFSLASKYPEAFDALVVLAEVELKREPERAAA